MELDIKLKIIGSIVTIAGGLGLGRLVKYLWLQYKKKKNAKLEKQQMEAIQYSTLIDALGKLSIDVKQVKDKVFPNGGTSIFDGITRLEKNVAEINSKIDSLEDTQKISLNMQKVAFWVSEKDGLFDYVSPALCRLLKRTESELLGNNWISCLLKADVDRVGDAWEAAIQEKRTFDEIFAFIDGNESNNIIRVHGLAFHKIDKTNGTYLGSYGTLTQQII